MNADSQKGNSKKTDCAATNPSSPNETHSGVRSNSVSETDSLEELTSTGVIPFEGRLAGIDYGTVRIGVAISDPGQLIASPLEVYQRRSAKLDEQFFRELATTERIVGFVVGLPVHMSGDPSEKSREAVAFGRWLSELTLIPVVWLDERYTTAMARDILSQTGLSGKKRKAKLDKLAAQILLASYLERSL